MAIELPAEQKVYTTTYSDFRGVDYTNDPTNVWRRRSPSGVNMLPDASGRPFKRCGWGVVKSEEDFISCLAEVGITVDSVSIYKCFYFELAGIDHIFIFTNCGVFRYCIIDEEEVFDFLDGSNTADCYLSWARAFFFEGNGKSAFYIYGNQRMWIYEHEEDFIFREATDDLYKPRVVVGANADGTGTILEGYNLAGGYAMAEYYSNVLSTWFGSDGLIFTVDTSTMPDGCNTYIYSSTDGWSPSLHSCISLSSTPVDKDTIHLVKGYGVVLPMNVSQDQLSGVDVFRTIATQFDMPLTVLDEYTTLENLTDDECALFTDYTGRKNATAWVMFHSNFSTQEDNGEDTIRVIFPTTEVIITPFLNEVSTGNGELM